MPPLGIIFYDDDNSTCSATSNKLDRLIFTANAAVATATCRKSRRPTTPPRRRVSFALQLNQTHEYPAVSEEERRLVWYSQEEELSFLFSAPSARRSLEFNTASSSSSTTNACTTGDGACSDNTKVLLRALQLGSLVVQGVCLRAVLLGHVIATEIYERETASDTRGHNHTSI
eukprot:scaffold5357_cov208-Amphora_coffeaeformis.AAC.16